jgi:hypothetical protein
MLFKIILYVFKPCFEKSNKKEPQVRQLAENYARIDLDKL